jgi:serine/threonine protein kinase
VEGTPFGRYRLVQLLGRGGMGEVWRAYDTETTRLVAVKLLPAHLATDTGFRQRFEREARSAALLNEPHIVPIHHFGEIDGRLYVDMRLVDGRDLETGLEDGPFEPARAVMIAEQVAAALNAAHRAGLIHRDVKPSNILIGEFDFAYLIDFGIARAVGESRLTNTGATIGTWAYMAPERIRSGQSDHRSDVYSLACVLAECLTGQQPFAGTGFEQLAAAHLWEPPPRPSLIRRGVPAGFDDVVAKGLAKDPEQRYQTALDLARGARGALTAHVPESPVRPPNIRRPPPAAPTTIAAPTPNDVSPRPPAQRRPPLEASGRTPAWWRHPAIVAGALALAVAVVIVVTLVLSRPDDATRAATSTETTSSTTSSTTLAVTTPSEIPPPPETITMTSVVPSVPPPPDGGARFITYSVTGTKAPLDRISVTYTDASGRQRTQQNVFIPWSLTVTPTSMSGFGSVQATSLLRLSKLNCTITTSDGQTIASQQNNDFQTNC